MNIFELGLILNNVFRWIFFFL